jgi:hypothetical protein
MLECVPKFRQILHPCSQEVLNSGELVSGEPLRVEMSAKGSIARILEFKGGMGAAPLCPVLTQGATIYREFVF